VRDGGRNQPHSHRHQSLGQRRSTCRRYRLGEGSRCCWELKESGSRGAAHSRNGSERGREHAGESRGTGGGGSQSGMGSSMSRTGGTGSSSVSGTRSGGGKSGGRACSWLGNNGCGGGSGPSLGIVKSAVIRARGENSPEESWLL
jgi:hypothetical protein